MQFMNQYDEDPEVLIQEWKIDSQEELDKLKEHLDYDEDSEFENVLELGNVFVQIMYDTGSGEFLAAEVVDTESYTWDLDDTDVSEIFGGKYLKPVHGRQ
ncbi:MAG: hypothetical protein IKS48_00105 [Eubacterium sp.]|nr:hypothetical protein [Eubacterium sp.]